MIKRVEQVIRTLNDAGVRAQRGYPSQRYLEADAPVAAVCLHGAQDGAVTVAVTLYGRRAVECENATRTVVEELTALGTECTVQNCGFDGHMDLFSLRILAQWPGVEVLDCRVYINDVLLDTLTGFSSQCSSELYQFTAEDGTVTILQNNKAWSLTVEELLPADAAPATDQQTPFTLKVTRAGGSECFTQCYWENVRRVDTPAGMRQVRTAKSWEERTIA